ncbi:hypothetical protein AAFF_G00245560 [Aldrovandia affinis]|uniref:Uncharacterized protein n=1 Tax=Aldrovandia affinis TaxID=143900 RepID=A0AAD7W3E5_9TELE|nr:hypothetical protein AAFF_G00245560 [Aldrovandia affinis]
MFPRAYVGDASSWDGMCRLEGGVGDSGHHVQRDPSFPEEHKDNLTLLLHQNPSFFSSSPKDFSQLARGTSSTGMRTVSLARAVWNLQSKKQLRASGGVEYRCKRQHQLHRRW